MRLSMREISIVLTALEDYAAALKRRSIWDNHEEIERSKHLHALISESLDVSVSATAPVSRKLSRES